MNKFRLIFLAAAIMACCAFSGDRQPARLAEFDLSQMPQLLTTDDGLALQCYWDRTHQHPLCVAVATCGEAM